MSDISALREQLEPYMPKSRMQVEVRIVGPADEAKPGEASVCGLQQCRRCGWQPPNTDAVSICYRCSWTDGCDLERTPRRPLVSLSEPAPAQAVEAGENVTPLRQFPKQSDEDQREARQAELRQQARSSNGEPPPPVQVPRINYTTFDGGSVSDLRRRIDASYV